MNIIYKSIGIAIAITVLTACAGPSKKTLLPDRGPTTMEAYENHLGGNYAANTSSSDPKDAKGKKDVNKKDSEPWDSVEGNRLLPRNTGKSSLVARELDAIKRDFRKVDNPEIVGYIYPHLSTNNHPVPGYFTAFNLYSGEHYAITRSEGEIYPARFTGGQ